MVKTKTLNGLAYSMAQSYFSTRNYYSKGYLCDWIVNGAFDLGIDEIKIDVLKKKINPMELEIKPLLIFLNSLIPIIEKTLKNKTS